MEFFSARARALPGTIVVVACSLVLTACGGGAATQVNDATGSSGSGSGGSTSPTTNHAPTISGTPPIAVQAGTPYTFTPTASDADGDALTFSVSNLPSWASFDTTTGRVSGSPTATGTFANVAITVSDGKASASLSAFTVTVNAAAAASGSARLTWVAPALRTDGSTLTNLAGFRIRYGLDADDLGTTVTLADPKAATYLIDNLGTGTYYFVVVAYDEAGVESQFSNVVSKSIG